MASIEEAKDIIKNTATSTIIGFYHPISKRGGNYEGICPFHSDTKPSLKINDQKGIYKCFACGAAGDAINFVKDFKNQSFIEAIKDIGDKLGVVVEDNQKKKQNPKVEMGLRVLTSALKFYKKVAADNKPPAYIEFLKQRNLNNDSITNFAIGYAPNGNQFLKYLNSIPNQEDKEKALAVAKEIGIVRDGQNGRGDYDFFRDRVVFPILDHFGNTRGFSSRAVLDGQKPKYLNSGESFLFDKRNILYGFHIAKSHIRNKDSAIIVEGNMDTIALHQYGFENSVATMGVALSENSAKLLSSLTHNIYFAMDSDDAGFQGMERMNSIFMSEGVLAKYLDFTPAKDPDEYLNQFGRLKLTELIEKASTFLDVLIQRVIPNPIPETSDQKLDALNKIFEIVAPLKKSLIGKEKVIEAASVLGLKSSNQDIVDAYENHLEEKDANILKYKKITEERKASQRKEIAATPTAEAVSHEKPAAQQILTKVQTLVLGQLIMHPECLDKEQITEILDFIDNNEVKRLISWLKSIYMEIDESDYVGLIKTKLEEELPEQLKQVIAKGLFDYDQLKLNEKVIDKFLNDLILNLKRDRYKTQRAELVQKQKQANTQEESNKLLEEILELDKSFRKKD